MVGGKWSRSSLNVWHLTNQSSFHTSDDPGAKANLPLNKW
jgi:hypothetical protein